MPDIYVVIGTTGAYSDRSEWLVCAYPTEAMAQRHAELAAEWYQANNCLARRHDDMFANPYDPGMSIDYTGTDWTVQKVPLNDALPSI